METRGNPAPATPTETRGPDSIIPSRMFEEKVWYSLTEGEKDVYVTLRRYSNKIGLTMMTLPGLRARSGLTTRQGLRKCLVGLKEKGALFKFFKPGDWANFVRPSAKPNTWVFYT